MREIFHAAAAVLRDGLRAGEAFALSFSGEDSDFARLSRGAVHQVGNVRQCELELRLILGKRHASLQIPLTGNAGVDRERVSGALDHLRAFVADAPEDPFLLRPSELQSGERIEDNRLPPSEHCVDVIQHRHRGLDLVGIFAAGAQYSGFADERGQLNWHEVSSHHLDWSVHGEDGRAAKASYAGFEFEDRVLAERAEQMRESLAALAAGTKTLEPGEYPVFLSPSAMDELFSLLSWGGFSARAQRTRTTPLLKLVEGQAQLSRELAIGENTRDGLSPDFDGLGFRRPPVVPLVEAGLHAGALVSPRSAAEFRLEANGANAYESPQSLDVASGELDLERGLEELGRGLYVSNLWYTNYSDRNACRTTGMTRFATLWVEDGQPVAGVSPMRFDDTLFRILGENLQGLTRQREFLPSADTYGSRSLRSSRVPGALVEKLAFTL